MTTLSVSDLKALLLNIYNLGRHNYRHTNYNDHDKAAQVQHDAEEMIDFLISEVLG